MATFTIQAFFLIPPGPGLVQTILAAEALDYITGTIGISNPLPFEPATGPAPNYPLGRVSLDAGSSYEELLGSNGSEGPSLIYGNSATIVPFGFGSNYGDVPVDINIGADDPAAGGLEGHSSYLVHVSLTVTNANRSAPPPLVSAAGKKALSEMTEQLDTLSRSFDIMNASNAAATGLKSANWVASTATNVLSPQIGLDNSIGQAALALTDTIIGTLEGGGNPVPLVLGAVSTLYALTGVVTGALANDPPDGNYTTVFQLPSFTYSIPNASATDDAIVHDSYDFLNDTVEMLAASERFQGANLANDSASAAVQSNAFSAAEAALTTDAAAVSKDLAAFQAELVSDGYADQGNGDGTLAAVQSEIASAGTADPYLTNLINETTNYLGASGAEAVAQQLVSDVATETAAPITGTAFSAIEAAGTDLSAYSAQATSPIISATVVGTGSWTILPGNVVSDTVVAPTGNDTVTSAANGALIFLGSGADAVTSGGADTVVGGSGTVTVSPNSFSDLVFSMGGPLNFIAGTGASTVVSGTVATTLFGGSSGGTLAFTDGLTDYIGAGATDTVVGLNGSLTVQGGAGGGLFFGGTTGDNSIAVGAGNVTAFGGGNGDLLSNTGAASALFAGGGRGAETLTGAGSTGANTFFGGLGPETQIGGAGNTALVAGIGSDLMIGGSGLTLFLFVAGRTAGQADTISGFDPTHDFVKITGYSDSEASVVANATTSNGSAMIALSDGTQITFAGVPSLNASSFT